MSSNNNYDKQYILPVLDKDFRPAAVEYANFAKEVENSGESAPLIIAVERGNGFVSVFKTKVFSESSSKAEENIFIIERIVKSLLWIWGGWKVTIAGNRTIGMYIRQAYSSGGSREFDAKFMEKVYEKPFTVEMCSVEEAPKSSEAAKPLGRNFEGCRIGLDLGGSDRKVSVVIDGNAVYSEEVVWHPKLESNPIYQYKGIMDSLRTAASKMPRVDAIGVSAAGIYINNRVMAASLFIKVPEDVFNEKVKDIFLDIRKEMGNVPFEVVNDGDVTALAGAMELDDVNVLGIAMGTSEAGGYVDGKGRITGWLNELAFVPVDFNEKSMLDEWSGDFGCGVKYFSQDSVIKLASFAGISFDEGLSPAEKLKEVQKLLEKGDERANRIFESIGCYLGYGIAYYSYFYDINNVLVLGRVTSGEGGSLILKMAEKVLNHEFPSLAKKIKLHLPDEKSRRVGQSVAAASLPRIR
jgi:predicted NBD/HSP70 family sugar kinase